MSNHRDHLGGLSEVETLARLTIAEKRRIARTAIIEFPHLNHEVLDAWLHAHGADSVPVEASLPEKTNALLDRCETLIRSDEDPEALDRFIYGQLSTEGLEAIGIDDEAVAKRENLDVWSDTYAEM